MRLNAITFLLAIPLLATAQTTSQRDSADYSMAEMHYNSGRFALCVKECKAIIDADTYFANDAAVLLALCRERQGFDRAAERIYRRQVNRNNASAAYRYADMLTRKGRLQKAESMAMKAIETNPELTDAHLLLATIEATQGRRFKAMMPLYYFTLINSDSEKQIIAYNQLISLWRRSAQTMQLIKRETTPDPFNDKVEQMIGTWATSDSIARMQPEEQIKELGRKTELLLDYLLANSELNLDFWQVRYTDFMIKLVPRNFVMPYIYHISDAAHHSEVLKWIAGPEGDLFNEFRLWMEAQ